MRIHSIEYGTSDGFGQPDISADPRSLALELDGAFERIQLELSDDSVVRALQDSPWERMQRQ